MCELQRLATVFVRRAVSEPGFSHHFRSGEPGLDGVQLLRRRRRFAPGNNNDRDDEEPFHAYLIYIVVLCQNLASASCSFHFSCSAVSTPRAASPPLIPYRI